MSYVRKYIRKTLHYSRFRFIFEMAMLSILFKIFMGFFLGFVATDFFQIDIDEKFYYEELNPFFLFILLCLIVPFFETFFQWLPIKILKKITASCTIIVILTAIIFAGLHLSYSVIYAIMIFPLALAVSWGFYNYYRKSFSEAFFVAFAIHSIHNLTAVLAIAI